MASFSFAKLVFLLLLITVTTTTTMSQMGNYKGDMIGDVNTLLTWRMLHRKNNVPCREIICINDHECVDQGCQYCGPVGHSLRCVE